jgi:hypothetical protein
MPSSRPGASIAVVVVSSVVVFVAGFSVALAVNRSPSLHWKDEFDWVSVSTLIAAVITCATMVAVGWAVTGVLEDRRSGKSFERELLAGFVRSAFVSAARVHDYVLHCRKQNGYEEADRKEFVALFTALGQDIQLIGDALESCGIGTSAEAAQQCRSEYKDLLTDHVLGAPFGPEDERNALLLYRKLKKQLVQLVVDVNRAG